VDAFERDFYEERRRKWRRSAFWRGVGATLLILIGLGALGAAFAPSHPHGPHIARLQVSDVIFDDARRSDLIAEIAENDDARALVVQINSPGGTTAGSEALFLDLRRVAGEKPVVAVLGEVAASGGYIAAISADHIVARGNTLTGSIGVIFEYPDVTGLMDRIGVRMETVRSSPLKAEPSPFRPTSPAATAVQEALIADSQDWFRGLVAERRDLQGPALDAVTDGRVFTGRMALEAGLIDAIGGEETAIAHLESLDPGLGELDIRNWDLPVDEGGFGGLFGRIGRLGTHLGLPDPGAGPRLMSVFK